MNCLVLLTPRYRIVSLMPREGVEYNKGIVAMRISSEALPKIEVELKSDRSATERTNKIRKSRSHKDMARSSLVKKRGLC